MKDKRPEKTEDQKATPSPEQEKSLGRDLELVEGLPDKTKELSTLMDASEKATGKERVAVTKRIRDKSKQRS